LIINPIEKEKWATELITEGNPITRRVSDSPRYPSLSDELISPFSRRVSQLVYAIMYWRIAQRVVYILFSQQARSLTRAQSFFPSDQMAPAGD
jgi:hypothetical protein